MQVFGAKLYESGRGMSSAATENLWLWEVNETWRVEAFFKLLNFCRRLDVFDELLKISSNTPHSPRRLKI